MKKIKFVLFATALVALSSCSDDTIEQKPIVPAEIGDEIMFGSSLENAMTRTVYDDEPTKNPDGTSYYRVSWEADGSDQVAIYCPQAAQTKLVKYSVTPDLQDPTHSSTVTKLNPDEAGLQWGSDDDHHFYAFYPASRVTGTEDGKIKGEVPTTQNVTSWNIQDNTEGGKTYYGKTNTDNAYMWAYGNFNRETMGNQDVPLTFHPWMTVLEITILGPQTGSKTVTNVNVRAIEGTQTALAGSFVCDMTPVEENKENGIPNYVPESSGTVNNTISISGYNSETQEFIELGPNDKMVVRAYLLPIDEQNATNARNIQISVATLNGAALTRTLGYSGHGENSIQPHKVNRVTLPRLVDTGTNYWMSSLDKDIYLSELSIPGSKFSYLTKDNNAFPVYQGATIQQQFLDGVRAFIVQVGARATYNATRTQTGDILGFPIYSYDYEYSDATLPIDGGNGQTLVNAINDIAAGLAQAESELKDRNLECAVVMLTYSGGNNVQVNFTGNPESRADVNTVGGADNVWMDAIEHELKDLSQEAANRIYTEPIDANTTLDDVKGKIIFKVNYNTDEQANHMSADAGVPALYSRWMSNSTMTTVPLRYGSANPDVTANLSWMYHEATHVGSNTEITQEGKESEVTSVLQNSVNAYLANDAHNIWYMVDAGGTFYDGAESNEGVINLTEWLNPIVRQNLQTRGQNAATGLVFFNFADKQANSGVLYETNELIQTIIDNNFKFNLRKAGSSTSQNAPADASFSNGGNVW